MKTKQLTSIPLLNLKPHPENPNKMSKPTFKKLCANIESTGNYEPIIVRTHPSEKGSFQIINGHHRVKALKEIGFDNADCIVWDVNDNQTRILLTTLNRLGGKDTLEKKSQLLAKLADRYSSGDLSKILPDSKSQIEKLQNLKTAPEFISSPKDIPETKIDLFPVAFVLSTPEKETLNKAISLTQSRFDMTGDAKGRSKALMNICEQTIRRMEAENG